ncbi:LexA family protein [Chitinophaga cymbidii]|nr:translesion error-prone DNA polymerase V autoproteolytic subunit [Chitinophaga cymbidii]
MRTVEKTATGRSGKHVHKIPFFDTAINAGFPSPAQDYHENEITPEELLSLTPSVFLIRVNGNSMEEAHMPHGSVVAVDRGKKAHHGDIVVGLLNKEFTIKRLVKSRAGWVLHPENSAYTPYLVKGDDEFEVWGVVKAIVIKL